VKYLILIYGNPASRVVWNELSADERRVGLDAYAALTEALAASGELIVTEALADPSLAKRINVQQGRTSTIDGPFAEAKEFVAGFYLVECDSTERVVEIAAQVPEADLGLVEVRGVMDLSGFEM
jgi:hypothetical protein